MLPQVGLINTAATSKVRIWKSKNRFLGHLVNAEDIRPLPENFLKLEVAYEPQKFITVVNFYRKFIPPAISMLLIHPVLFSLWHFIE